ncbi:MAG: hypothetical protein ACI8R8_003013 [Paraglaciecola sp.]|jgi:hypothetical protein
MILKNNLAVDYNQFSPQGCLISDDFLLSNVELRLKSLIFP